MTRNGQFHGTRHFSPSYRSIEPYKTKTYSVQHNIHSKSAIEKNPLIANIRSLRIAFVTVAVVSRTAFAFCSPPTTRFRNTPSVNMVATDIDGKAVAEIIRQELKGEVDQMSHQPGLAVILVGARRDSQTYVKMKKKACAECGIASYGYDFEDTADEEDIIAKILELNAMPTVHGILVQLPLPKHMDEHKVLDLILPEKDVD